MPAIYTYSECMRVLGDESLLRTDGAPGVPGAPGAPGVSGVSGVSGLSGLRRYVD
jgi:hypothetical protein